MSQMRDVRRLIELLLVAHAVGHWLVWATAWMGFGTGSGFWWAVLIVGGSVAIAGELMGFILWLVPR
jgi:hypothetical protein